MTKYIVSIKQLYKFLNEKEFTQHTNFCFNNFDKLNRYFAESEHRKLIEIIVKKRHSKKVIYKGNNYDDYLKAIKDYCER